LKAILSR